MSLNDTALVTLIQAKAHLRIDAAASLHVDAEYVGMGDNSETHFALDHVSVEGSLRLYVNGELQTETTHYSTEELVIIFVTAPANNLPITASYNYSASLGAADEHEHNDFLGTGDNSNKEFDTLHTPIDGRLKLYVDADLQVLATDYTISGTTITFVTAPHNKDIVTAVYFEAVSSGGSVFESYDDELLENLINAATKKAEDETGRAFIIRDITETHIGDNKQVLRLYKQPVVSITSVHVGVDEPAYSERLTIGRLYHLVVWPLDYEIVVVYTAGYAETRAATQALVPDAVAAVLLMVAYLYENRVDMVHGESVTGLGSVTYELPLYIDKSGAKQYLNALRVSVL